MTEIYIPTIEKYVGLHKVDSDQHIPTSPSIEERREKAASLGKKILTNNEWMLTVLYALPRHKEDKMLKALLSTMSDQEVELVDTSLKDLEKVEGNQYKVTICEGGKEITRIKIASGWQYVLEPQFLLPVEAGEERRPIQNLGIEGDYFSEFILKEGVLDSDFYQASKEVYLLRNSARCDTKERILPHYRLFSILAFPFFKDVRPVIAIATRYGGKEEHKMKPLEDHVV